jgi:hypothetical protein
MAHTPMDASVGDAGPLTRIPTVDDVLHDHATALGHDFFAYRNHVYRVVNLCAAFVGRSELEKIAVAAGLPRPRDLDERHVRLHRAVYHARTRLPDRPRASGLDRRDRRDDREPPQDHAVVGRSRFAPRGIPASRLNRRDPWTERVRHSASVRYSPVRDMAERRVSLASRHVDSRSVPKPSADAFADGQTVMATRCGRNPSSVERPVRRRLFRVQNMRKSPRCQVTTVSGLTT